MLDANSMGTVICRGFEETSYLSPMGRIILTSDTEALVGLRFDDGESKNGGKDFSDIMKAATRWLDDYFGGGRPSLRNLKFRLDGTPFQQNVWREISRIPYGETTSYGAIARVVAAEMGLENMSAQAIGNAVGKNPIPIMVPCHRVVGADGSMTGYAWGIDKKRFLLDLERKYAKGFGTN